MAKGRLYRRRIDLLRKRRRSLLSILPMLLGAGTIAAMSFVVWRMLHLETSARAAEIDRATQRAEQVLRAASRSAAVVDRLPPAAQFVIRDGRVVVDDEIGWLTESSPRVDHDLVVADRLARAERAEFVAGDRDAAQREYGELLAAPLPNVQRLVVVAAAAWFAMRGSVAAPVASIAPFVKELDERIGALDAASLGRLAIANAVAATLRLPRDGALPTWIDRVAPRLPPVVAASLPRELARADEAARLERRRALLRAADAEWRDESSRGEFGVRAVGAGDVLCWITDAAGQQRGALVSIDSWFDAVRAAGRDGALPEWPWLVEPVIGANVDAPYADVPHVRGVRAVRAAPLQEHAWVLPATAVLLLLGFGVAAWQQLRAAGREATAVRAQAEFLTTVTHELRTPLASIRLLGEMLADGRARGRETEYYAMLTGESARLSMLIENVLDLGRLERGERAQDVRSVELAAVVGETLALFEPLAQRERLRIVWNDRVGDEALARLDRGAFVQALVCVLDNARKYGVAGGVVEVDAVRDGASLLLRVRDRGAGVPADERERVFERFVRGSAHAHGSTPGLGIGLHLARTIVRRMGGELVCEAPADGGPGACFTFTIPAEVAA